MTDGGQKPKSSAAFHFVAGLSSGITTAILLQPADLLKTRVQQSKSSSLTSALRAILSGPAPLRQLWRGTTPSVIRTGAGSALYFGLLNQLRLRFPVPVVANIETTAAAEALPSATTPKDKSSSNSSSSSNSKEAEKEAQKKTKTKPNNTANLLTGALARASAGLIMSPITVLKVRYESSLYNYTSLPTAFLSIYKSPSGLKGYFAGFGATAVRDAPYAGLYVLFYEQCKDRLSPALSSPSSSSSATMATSFVSGVAAATLATAVTNPFDAIKTRLQLQPEKYSNLVYAARKMVGEEGARCLFDGLGLRIARKALSSALAWTVYEELIRRAEDRIVG